MAAGQPRIDWNIEAFAQIRRLEGVKKALYELAKKGANAAGDGFVARAGDRPTRARAAVIAATIRARHANARDHTLLGPVVDAMRES
ncbi:hypothetical protein SAMN04244553_3591 [Nocardia amikacinitolerans]|uniref:Uncharacterized protein n=1 Tax=Nocardia amikacinitolerans TaxID=756689 RepID=A0A285LGH6_9NOCA|nr:hypothetical protein [Nocardia amikacinitolerans]SNY84045.1 hypothetical protein SAMN04244553_3591 [Nocardia amikacinitolerans]